MVLAQPRPASGAGAGVLAGGGGVGKTQLAAWYARHTLDTRRADLIVWVLAGSEDQIITTYAHAAVRLALPSARDADPAEAAAAFCEWLHSTDRRWLIVLDDITDPAQLRRWWPADSPSGVTLATTRQRQAWVTDRRRRRIDIDVYDPSGPPPRSPVTSPPGADDPTSRSPPTTRGPRCGCSTDTACSPTPPPTALGPCGSTP